jgi:predicted enzyme related to lactoylglutathione lyase
MPNIGWFDIPADDVGRAKKFYQSLLGWKIEPAKDFPDQSQQRQSIITGTPQEGSMHSGGLYKRMMPGGILVFVIVEDIDRVLARVEKLGGKILMPRTEIKDLGLVFGVIEDTEGNKLGLWKPA